MNHSSNRIRRYHIRWGSNWPFARNIKCSDFLGLSLWFFGDAVIELMCSLVDLTCKLSTLEKYGFCSQHKRGGPQVKQTGSKQQLLPLNTAASQHCCLSTHLISSCANFMVLDIHHQDVPQHFVLCGILPLHVLLSRGKYNMTLSELMHVVFVFVLCTVDWCL